MEFVRGIHNLKSHHRGCALAIGNFDGFHRGHYSLIVKLQEAGNNRGLPVVVMIFEPQPREYFLDKPVRLFSFRDKFLYFFDSGIDILLCVLFNSKIASLDPYSFVSNILVKKLNVRLICIGENFRFGAFRQGNVAFLNKMSLIFGFEVLKVDTFTHSSGCCVSSTAVRSALRRGALVEAETLLGHPYLIFGRVVYGMQLASLIGFPTLNILLKRRRLLISGVYAVKVFGVCDQILLGVANIGVCPTVHKDGQQRLEVHLLDEIRNLYNCYIQIMICVKIRDEQYFSSFEELRVQIKKDIKNVRKYFNKE